MHRCPNGSHRNKITKKCDPVKKRKRCPNGSRKDRKTKHNKNKTRKCKKYNLNKNGVKIYYRKNY